MIPVKRNVVSAISRSAIKIGAVAAGTALAAIGMYKLKESGKLDPLIDKGKQMTDAMFNKDKAGDSDNIGQWKINDLPKPEKVAETVGGIKKLAKSESLSETLNKVNPHLGDKAYENNCTFCSITAFLRQHGLDATAGKTRGKQQNLGGIVEKCFKGAKVLDGSAVKFGKSRQDAVEMLLKRYGQNAEGVCSIQWKRGNGHAFNWKIKDGIVSFFDSQSGLDDSMVSRFWSNGLIDPNGSLQIARLDGLEIDFDAVKDLLK